MRTRVLSFLMHHRGPVGRTGIRTGFQVGQACPAEEGRYFLPDLSWRFGADEDESGPAPLPAFAHPSGIPSGPETGPDVLVMSKVSKEYGPVVFSHRLHAEMSGDVRRLLRLPSL